MLMRICAREREGGRERERKRSGGRERERRLGPVWEARMLGFPRKIRVLQVPGWREHFWDTDFGTLS